MKKIAFAGLILIFLLLPTASAQQIAISKLYLNNTESVMSWLAFHESSESVGWYIRQNQNDTGLADNISITFDCGGSVAGSFYTTDYDTWNQFGYIQINLDYEDENYRISYNENPFTAKYLRCEFTASAVQFINNSAYDYIEVEFIPTDASLEFVDCSGISSSEISITGSIGSLVSLMGDMWEIAWLIYSIAIIVLAVFGIPIFVFMLIRYLIYKLTGYRIGGSR